MQITTVQQIQVRDLDALVTKTYGRPYRYQQQDGCRDRHTVDVCVPDEPDDFDNDEIPEEINGAEMGVSFAAWLARDPLATALDWSSWEIALFWERNFYPDLGMVLNDLHSRGLLPAGDYQIVVDW